MDNNQINGQKNNKEAYCPNPIFNNGTIAIGEFKTLDDAMGFPLKEIWCINRKGDNKFQGRKVEIRGGFLTSSSCALHARSALHFEQ